MDHEQDQQKVIKNDEIIKMKSIYVETVTIELQHDLKK